MHQQFMQGHPAKKVKPDQAKYRANMVRSFHSLENMEEENEDQESPHFGGTEQPPTTIFRHFSFGDRIG